MALFQSLVHLGLSLAVLMYRLVKKSFGRRWEDEGEGVCQVVACPSHQTERCCKYLWKRKLFDTPELCDKTVNEQFR